MDERAVASPIVMVVVMMIVVIIGANINYVSNLHFVLVASEVC